MSEFVLSIEADEDLQSIFLYSIENFGEAQAERYVRHLYETFQMLADHPNIGRLRPELGDEMRSFPHQRHVIFAIPVGTRTGIVRVVHGARDLDAIFGGDAPPKPST